jgi:CHAT domain-containing protein/tetratricopeptide (TPR) repeat protein
MGARGERVTVDLQQQLLSLEQEFTYWIRSDIARADAIAAAMIQLTEGAGPCARALALRAHGSSLRAQGKLPDALQEMNRSLKLFLEAGEEVQWARTVIASIPVFVQLERNKQAVTSAEEALEVFLRHQEFLAAARLLNNMGALYGNMGRSLDALRCFTRGGELSGQANDKALQARFANNRAKVLQQLGRHKEAISACAACIRHVARSGEQVLHARTLQVAAVSLFHLGHFGKALRRFARARAMLATLAAPRDVALCDMYIAGCYVELNRCEEALVRLGSVIESFDQEQWGYYRAWSLLYQGMAQSRRDRKEQALFSLHEAYQWFRAYDYSAWAGRALLEEADVRLSRGDTREAILAARQAAGLFAAARQRTEEARANLIVAEGSLLVRRIKHARQAAEKAYKVFVQAHMPGPLFRSLHLLGRVAAAQKDWDGARRYLTRAVATAERVRATVQLSFRRAFLDDKSAAYADLVRLHLQRGRVRAAHGLADQAKSRSLVDVLAAPPDRREYIAPADLELLAELDSVRRQYQALTTPVQAAPELMVRGSAPSAVAQRKQLEERLAALWDEWELRQAANVGQPMGARATAERWFTRLPAGGCMVEYFVAGDRTVAFVADRRGLRGWVDLGSSDAVRKDLELLQLNLDTTLVTLQSGMVPPGLTRNARALLAGLYDRLWAPLAHLVGRRERAVVVPHGYLHLVPFEALYDGERFLVERMEISLAPSRAAWLRCLEKGDRPAVGSDLVLGYNPGGALPFVEEEVRWVAGALQAEAYLNEAATVDRLLQAGARRLVHVAVHGEFRLDNPHFSTLLLGSGSLTAADAARLGLNAGLVVLSGCETGLSRITRGEELMGMISAFLQAGCASVLASRWRVDDRVTAELMHRFYEGLLAGQSKAAALREAQASMAQRNVHPLCWAAFGLVGHGGMLQ